MSNYYKIGIKGNKGQKETTAGQQCKSSDSHNKRGFYGNNSKDETDFSSRIPPDRLVHNVRRPD